MAKEQYLYKLKLIPELLDDRNWTEKEHQVIQDHFHSLQKLNKEGSVLIAGKTQNTDSTMFGIVIIEVHSEVEARELMNNDPAVKHGIMTATLFPFRIAIS